MTMKQDQLLKIYDDATANLLLLDVRTPHEFKDHRIPGSLNIPIDEIENRLQEIPKEKTIITICEHGVRSGIVEKYLSSKGYTAESLDGGLANWQGQLSS